MNDKNWGKDIDAISIYATAKQQNDPLYFLLIEGQK